MTNPTFDFKWDVKEKKSTSSKVFARRRPQKTTISKEAKSVEKEVRTETEISEDNKTSTKTSAVNTQNSEPLKFKKTAETKQAEGNINVIQKTRKRLNESLKNEKTAETKHACGSVNVTQKKHKNVHEKVGPLKESATEKLFTSNRSFRDLKQIHNHIISNLEKHDFLRLTTVQEKAIPIIVEGKNTLVNIYFLVTFSLLFLKNYVGLSYN